MGLQTSGAWSNEIGLCGYTGKKWGLVGIKPSPIAGARRASGHLQNKNWLFFLV